MIAFDLPGYGELLIIVFVVLLLFGAKKLPEMARSLGRSSREFKKGLQEGAEDEKSTRPTSDKTPETKPE